MGFRLHILSSIALLSLSVGSLHAKPMPTFEDIGPPAERLILSESVQRIQKFSAPEDALGHADVALAALRSQTVARGALQFMRARMLYGLNRHVEAQKAIDESVRLLPDFSAPLILGAEINTFSGRPEAAATLYFRAIRLDPEDARAIPSYDIGALARRLSDIGQEATIAELAEKLIGIGWRGEDQEMRSELVRSLIEHRLKQKNYTAARALVPELFVPSHMYYLLQLTAAKPIWEDIEAWAGSKLEKQWPIYLREARDRWDANPTATETKDYLKALGMADHDATIIRELLPRFTSSTNAESDYDLVYAVSAVARALASANRWVEVDSLYQKFEVMFPLESSANALNLPINRGFFLLLAGKPEAALGQFDTSLKLAKKWNDEVNTNATMAIHMGRVCAAREAGREVQVSDSIALLEASARSFPVVAAKMHLCLNRLDDAQSVMLKGLEQEATRSTVLLSLQPGSDNEIATAYGLKHNAWWQKLSSDKVILAAAKKHGRILPFALTAGAPAEVMRTLP